MNWNKLLKNLAVTNPDNKLITGVLSSPALVQKSEHYPAERYDGKTPLKVRMKQKVTSDLPPYIPLPKIPPCLKGTEHWVWVNSHGAVAVVFPDGQQLGIKPGEFEVILYHEDETGLDLKTT